MSRPRNIDEAYLEAATVVSDSLLRDALDEFWKAVDTNQTLLARNLGSRVLDLAFSPPEWSDFAGYGWREGEYDRFAAFAYKHTLDSAAVLEHFWRLKDAWYAASRQRLIFRAQERKPKPELCMQEVPVDDPQVILEWEDVRASCLFRLVANVQNSDLAPDSYDLLVFIEQLDHDATGGARWIYCEEPAATWPRALTTHLAASHFGLEKHPKKRCWVLRN